MARTKEEVIAEMVDSGLFTDDEIKAAVSGAPVAPASAPTGAQSLAEQAVGFMRQGVPTAAQVATTGPMSLLPGLIPATSRVGGMGANIAETNPQAALTAIKTTLPIAAGVATGGLGVIPAAIAAGTAGIVGEDINMAGQALLGLPGVPQTGFGAAKQAATEGAKQAALEVGGRTIGGILPIVKNMAKNRLASLTKDPETAKAVLEASPEITKKGFYKENFLPFTEKVVGGIKSATEKAKALSSDFLKTFGGREAGKVEDYVGDFKTALNAIQKEVQADPKVAPHIKDVSKRLYLLGEGKTPMTVDKAKALEALYSDILDEVIPVATERTQPVIQAMMDSKKALQARLGAIPEVGDALKAAKLANFEKFTSSRELKNIIGVQGTKPTDFEITTKMRQFLGNSEKLADPDILKQLNKIEPGLATFAKKLATAKGDPFSAMNVLVPLLSGTTGLAATGWATNNPIKALTASVILAGLGAATSPKLASAAFRGLKKAAPLAPFAKPLLPGIKRVYDASQQEKK